MLQPGCDTPWLVSAIVDEPAAAQPGAAAHARPAAASRRAHVFDAELVNDLRDQANEAFAHFSDRLDGNTLFVTKHTLASVHDCEVHFLAPDDFEWTPARARGQVAHKAIQLMLNWRGEPSPRELVDEALGPPRRRGARLRPLDRRPLPRRRGRPARPGGRAGQQVLRDASRRSTSAATRPPRLPPSGRSTTRSCCGPASIS